ncbi:UDP-N-acetylmuramoyl-L-alanine--D-glutamate ligase, partial [Thermodesulfobacteriota bacterium]
TNGKTTSVSLLGSMIERAESKVFVGGNIGTPLMEYAAGEKKADYAVVEVSSFQLDTIEQLCPEISMILNISPDHLDRYPDYEAYVGSKLRIYQDQKKEQFTIFNDDDERLARTKPKGPVTVLRYGWEPRKERHAYMQGDRLVAKIPGKEESIFFTEKYKLPGKHNIENLMGVVLAGLVLDLSPDAIQGTIDTFRGLSHRMELVGTIEDVDFIDDSKATNVDAASRAVSGFDRPLILISGGRHKWGDYSPLVKVSEGKVKKVILLGEAKDIMADSFKDLIPYSFAESMEDAVSQAFSASEAGDVVLLAPACSSFDMFSDYGHRGQVFREAVKRLNNGGE